MDSATKTTFVGSGGMHGTKIDTAEVDCGSQESLTRIMIQQQKVGGNHFNYTLKIVMPPHIIC